MTLGSFNKVAAAALVAVVSATSAFGAVIYDDRALFEAGLASSDTVDFEGTYGTNWNSFSNASGLTQHGVNFVGPFSFGHYLYVGESDTNTWGTTRGLVTGDFIIGEGRGAIDVALPSAHTAVGFDFIVGEGVQPGSLWEISVDVVGEGTFTRMVEAEALQFFGIVSNTGISSLSFRTTLDQRPPQIGMDNLVFGTSSAAVPVPLPATLPLLLAGLGVLGVARHRRRAAA